MIKIILCLVFFKIFWAQAEFKNKEALLIPAGFSTADVLKSSEILFAPQGWVSYGTTDRLTLTWDWFVTLGGIPAAQLRYLLAEDDTTKKSIELYGVYFSKDIKDERDPYFKVNHRQGGNTYLRFNQSRVLTSNIRVHGYLGATYSDFEEFEPTEKSSFLIKTYDSFWIPDFGLALEFQISTKFFVHFNLTSGNTFVLFDQITHKQMAILGLHFAPFDSTRTGFLKNFRIELDTIYVKIKDAAYEKTYAFYPVLYWQWQTGF
jgi:hypothetical protein